MDLEDFKSFLQERGEKGEYFYESRGGYDLEAVMDFGYLNFKRYITFQQDFIFLPRSLTSVVDIMTRLLKLIALESPLEILYNQVKW
jgi:hypothetical protein